MNRAKCGIPDSVNGFGGYRWQPPSKQLSKAHLLFIFIVLHCSILI
mgnify:CR=1 FL=1